MSRRTEKRNLTVTLEHERFAARSAKSKRSGAKRKRVEGKGTLRDKSLQAGAESADTTVTPPKTRKSPARTNSLDKRALVKARALARKNVSDELTLTVDEPKQEMWAKPQEQDVLQDMFAVAPSEARPELDITMNREMCHEPESVVADNTSAAPQVIVPETEPEVTTNPIEVPPSTGLRWGMILQWMATAGSWIRKQLSSRQSRKRLRVCETVSLGEKRFVAVIEVDGEQFLVGGAASSVATLARLEPPQEFSEVLKRRWAQDPVQA
jgi:hypothetical protein